MRQKSSIIYLLDNIYRYKFSKLIKILNWSFYIIKLNYSDYEIYLINIIEIDYKNIYLNYIKVQKYLLSNLPYYQFKETLLWFFALNYIF